MINIWHVTKMTIKQTDGKETSDARHDDDNDDDSNNDDGFLRLHHL
jgi:hypothetical protein